MAFEDAISLKKQFLDSLAKEDNSRSSDPILTKFKRIRDKLEDISTELTDPEYISCLYDLNDVLAEWQILKQEDNPIKRIFPFQDPADLKKELSEIEERLKKLHDSPVPEGASRVKNLQLFDRYTFYKPDLKDEVSDEHEKQMVDWLLTSVDDFKVVGIYGTGGSGKTPLVKNVLNQKAVGDKFKSIIWACLSQLTSEKEIDDWIIKHFLYCLGLDIDNMVGDVDEDEGKAKDWLMKELERRIKESRNYILVLDDMWHCSKWLADDLLGKLKNIGGGAVIVTSRRKSVAEKFWSKIMLIHLKPLEKSVD